MFEPALYCFGVYSVVMRDCHIIENDMNIGAAAFFSQSFGDESFVSLEHCTFDDNVGSVSGLALTSEATLVMTNCTVRSNSGGSLGSGGINIVFKGPLEQCTLADNSGGSGAALSFESHTNITASNCVFSENAAFDRGGAILVYVSGQTDFPNPPTFERCTFVGNSAAVGSIIAVGSGTIQGDAEITIKDSIIWDNGASLFDPSDGEINVSYSLVQGGYTGVGNIDEDPQFADVDAGDFSLTAESPCIDAGDLASPLDPDGTTADMGAYFFAQFGFLRGDVNGDGTTSTLIDALALLIWQFGSGAAPPCMDAADIDDNGAVEPLIDSISLLSWNFLSGPAPPDPGPATCGVDSSDDSVDCAELMECQ